MKAYGQTIRGCLDCSSVNAASCAHGGRGVGDSASHKREWLRSFLGLTPHDLTTQKILLSKSVWIMRFSLPPTSFKHLRNFTIIIVVAVIVIVVVV